MLLNNILLLHTIFAFAVKRRSWFCKRRFQFFFSFPLFGFEVCFLEFKVCHYFFFFFLPLFSPEARRHWTRYGKQTALYGRYHSNCLILWFALGFPLPLSILFALLKVQSAINSKVAEKLHLSVFLLALSLYIYVIAFYCHPVFPFLKRTYVFIKEVCLKSYRFFFFFDFKIVFYFLIFSAVYFVPFLFCYIFLLQNTIRMKK